MKYYIIIVFLFLFGKNYCQNFYLNIEGSTSRENQIIDSLNYSKKHSTVASILESQKDFENKIVSKGYFSFLLIEQKKVNDSTFLFQYKLGKKIKEIIILNTNLSEDEKNILSISKDTITLQPQEVENWMNERLYILEQKGFALSKLQLINHTRNKNIITSTLYLQLNSLRTINDFVILGYEDFPKNIKKNWLKKYQKTPFNSKVLEAIKNDINEFPFVTQSRSPEILFTKDSTKIYTYLNKTKPNKFDGFIGFSNNENDSKLQLNGYLDLNLINILNSGEKFNLYWRNDGEKQTSFNISTEIPYLFKSPLGTKANLKIFKQDSIFQNTQFNFDLGYYLSYNKKIYLGYQSTNSTDIQNINNVSLNDFNNSFFTLSLDYIKRDIDNFIFPEKIAFLIKSGIGNRTLLQQKTKQFFSEVNTFYNLNLNQRNSIHIKNQTFYLDSKTYVINELYRFGGMNSIRGFRENTLQANFFSGLITEYRYLLSSNLFIHTISDYGYFQDKTTNLKGNLLGIGFGVGVFTKNGLLNLIYSNGTTENQSFKLSNSILQISFNTNF